MFLFIPIGLQGGKKSKWFSLFAKNTTDKIGLIDINTIKRKYYGSSNAETDDDINLIIKSSFLSFYKEGISNIVVNDDDCVYENRRRFYLTNVPSQYKPLLLWFNDDYIDAYENCIKNNIDTSLEKIKKYKDSTEFLSESEKLLNVITI
jgi:hypothetical protein